MTKPFFIGNPSLASSLKTKYRNRYSRTTRVQEPVFDGNKPVLDPQGKQIVISRNVRVWLDGAPGLKQFAAAQGCGKVDGIWMDGIKK